MKSHVQLAISINKLRSLVYSGIFVTYCTMKALYSNFDFYLSCKIVDLNIFSAATYTKQKAFLFDASEALKPWSLSHSINDRLL